MVYFQKLFETIIDHMANFTVNEGLFEVVHSQLKKNYYNQFIKPNRLVKYVIDLLHCYFHFCNFSAIKSIFCSQFPRDCGLVLIILMHI